MAIEVPGQLDVYQATLRLLASGSAGIFTDLDGTLAPLRSNPKDVSISSKVRNALSELNRRLPVVVLTGRCSREAREIVGLDSLIYAGNHGLEIIRPGDLRASYTNETRSYMGSVNRVFVLANLQFESSDIAVENKMLSVSLHYRNAMNAQTAREAINDFIRIHCEPNGLQAHYGKMVVDLRPPTGDKGTALLALASDLLLDRAIVLGDDATDVSSFRAVSRFQTDGDQNGLRIAVATSGTPRDLIAIADHVLSDTQDVETLLDWLATKIA